MCMSYSIIPRVSSPPPSPPHTHPFTSTVNIILIKVLVGRRGEWVFARGRACTHLPVCVGVCNPEKGEGGNSLRNGRGWPFTKKWFKWCPVVTRDTSAWMRMSICCWKSVILLHMLKYAHNSQKDNMHTQGANRYTCTFRESNVLPSDWTLVMPEMNRCSEAMFSSMPLWQDVAVWLS